MILTDTLILESEIDVTSALASAPLSASFEASKFSRATATSGRFKPLRATRRAPFEEGGHRAHRNLEQGIVKTVVACRLAC